MSKVAFFLENHSISKADCRDILHSNPGIGGTEYLIILVSYLLHLKDNDLEISLFVESSGLFPEGLKIEVVNDIIGAQNRAISSNCDYLIFKHNAEHIQRNYLRSDNSIKLISWCHIFLSFWELDYYANNPAITRVIFVGKEMRDLYRDHPIFSKSDFIYNCLNLAAADGIMDEHPFQKRENIVTYMGSLVPYKGFHILAESWKEITEAVPDAQLYIIGSAKVYNQSASLGRYGYADEEYENRFMPFLCQNGEIMSNVHFMGQLGKEKYEILSITKVGVPNPSGKTETFCLTAVEMQMMGAKIVTLKAPGYIDTVRNGIFYHRGKPLAKSIIKILKGGANEGYDQAMSFFNNNFSFDATVKQWEQLLKKGELNNNSLSNCFYRYKWIKELRRKCCLILPVLYKLPYTERIIIYFERALYGRTTYMDS